MTTFTGTQANFLDAVKDLVELEYDIVEAYEEAINKINNSDYQNKLGEFCQNHEQHIMELSLFLRKHKEEAPTKSSGTKAWLTKGKVIIAGLVGDQIILKAIASNEMDASTAYERISKRNDLLDDAKEIIQNGLEDERDHKRWLEEIAYKN